MDHHCRPENEEKLLFSRDIGLLFSIKLSHSRKSILYVRTVEKQAISTHGTYTDSVPLHGTDLLVVKRPAVIRLTPATADDHHRSLL